MAGGNIKVVVRVRPFNRRELDRNARCIVQMKDAQTVLIPPLETEDRLRKGKGGDGGRKVFAFDKSYWSFDRKDPHFAGQGALFGDLGIPLLDNAFQGYNNCIFAYGQTGSGKSYSMMGYGEEAGVIPKICQDMFERITAIQADKNLSCTVEVSYLEIYNERVRDLLNPATKGNLKVREHPSTGPYVEDLAKLVVRSFKEIENLMDEGNKARTVAATNMNETSSRSHAVFTLTLTQKRHDVETRMDTEKVAKISLVDLAGSERATSTGATGARLKEGAEINRSLSTLGRVIAALADLSSGKKKNASLVPYRDSVLTWLLKDSLGGNSLTAMIAAISPADINFEETLSTLRYADSAKRIKNHAVVNEDPNARMIRELKEELAQLRSKLGSGATSGGIAEEQYSADTPLDKQIVSITQADGTIKKVSKAEIAEQLNQSEKLYEDLNQTWEEKLQKTEQIHKEREAALEELGISIEKGFVGLSTPKKMPHLVNLSDDPLLAECLVYNIKPGTTTVGNVEDVGSSSEIRLNGSKILTDHCKFENTDNMVTVIPREGAAVMVNGLRIDKPKRLRSGNRIILGDFHIFRFNHPQEAQKERAEQSLLRHSVTTSQLGSPAPRPNHERSASKTGSDVDTDISRAESPFPITTGRDSDWSFARREAANAILGVDQKISHLTDEELDTLFDDVQRARAVRRGRPESRMFGHEEEDVDSVSSYPMREKYMSNGTIDNYSLDTSLTVPTTPQIDDEDGAEHDDKTLTISPSFHARLNEQEERLREEAREHEEKLQEKIRQAEISMQQVEELKAEKERSDSALKSSREEFQAQLAEQKTAFEAQTEELLMSKQPPSVPNSSLASPGRSLELGEVEKLLAVDVLEKWRQLRAIRLAQVILKHAALLKEAQVMSRAMDKLVTFQFTVVHPGQDLSSSYDLVMSGISDDDDALETAPRPCIAVRVTDFQHLSVRLWSLEKLELRVQAMRQMHQYIDRPDYMQHFRIENPFVESFLPRYSLVGDAQVPLTAVFEARVQDCSAEVISPYTRETIGSLKLSLEPSSAQAPSSMLKFNVVMHELFGFAEHEGTEVHAQLFVPGNGNEGGATTTQMIRDFNEGPVHFDSVHSMSVPLDSTYKASLQVSIFARITALHLDKLLSWDEIRESIAQQNSLSDSTAASPCKPKTLHRLPEPELSATEHHDVFAKLQILELSESGTYYPVEVEQPQPQSQHCAQPAHLPSQGTYQLHQGLQRRIHIQFTHTTSSLPILSGTATTLTMKAGSVRLLDPWGKIPSMSSQTPDMPLRLVSLPNVTTEPGGATHAFLVGQWDSSLHDSSLLDRPTPDRYTVQITLTVEMHCKRSKEPLAFTFEERIFVRPRMWMRPQSLFKQLWGGRRVVHSTTQLFAAELKPPKDEHAWRRGSYVPGEEDLTRWSPRGASLLEDYIKARRRAQKVRDVEAARLELSTFGVGRSLASGHGADTSSADEGECSQWHTTLLTQCLHLWPRSATPITFPSLARPSTAGASQGETDGPSADYPLLAPSVKPLRPSAVIKSGFLLTPSLPSYTQQAHHPSSYHSARQPPSLRWTRLYAELRPPWLHLYAVPSSEPLTTISLRNAVVDSGAHLSGMVSEDDDGDSHDDHDDDDGDGDERDDRGGRYEVRGRSGGRDGGGEQREYHGLRERGCVGGETLFAVYGEGGSWVFRARSERGRGEWVLGLDRGFAEGG